MCTGKMYRHFSVNSDVSRGLCVCCSHVCAGKCTISNGIREIGGKQSCVANGQTTTDNMPPQVIPFSKVFEACVKRARRSFTSSMLFGGERRAYKTLDTDMTLLVLFERAGIPPSQRDRLFIHKVCVRMCVCICQCDPTYKRTHTHIHSPNPMCDRSQIFCHTSVHVQRCSRSV